MILFFDTETTGKADFNAHASAKHQPHLVQLAAVLTDNALNVRHRFSAIVQPDGWTIPDSAAAIHGITTEIATAVGFALSDVLHHFCTMDQKAKIRVAHNINFERHIMRSAFYRMGDELPDDCQEFCTMEAMTDICQLPGPYGPYGYKWPKLSEAYHKATGLVLLGAHDAMADVLACIEVYRWFIANAKPAETWVAP